MPSQDGRFERNAYAGAGTTSIQVDGADQVGETRRAVLSLAENLQFDESQAARSALIAVELASNLWRHAGGGEILVTPLNDEGVRTGIELMSVDKGPGMADVQLCFQDGYSTAGSSGTGLGAIRRLSSMCEVYSGPGKGTAVLTRCWSRPSQPSNLPAHRLEIGAVSVPMPGETASGDSYAVSWGPDYTNIMVVDGLGHGPIAAQCALAAVEAFLEYGTGAPLEVLDEMHPALRATRGAAAAVARFDHEREELRFAGLGNIAGTIIAEGTARQTVSVPGILGHNNRGGREFSYRWPPDSVVLLYSDGIASHWSPGAYDGLWRMHPSLIAGVLYRDLGRNRDDATMLVVRRVTGR